MMKALKFTLILTFGTVLYVAISSTLSSILFWDQSNGSLIRYRNQVIGSRLIGQDFSNEKYFMGRPSINNYNARSSANSNLPYYSTQNIENIKENSKKFSGENIDLNLISESGSGLDPHITYEGALLQIERVSKSNNISTKELKSLVDEVKRKRFLNIVGPEIVNVLELNILVREKYASKI